MTGTDPVFPTGPALLYVPSPGTVLVRPEGVDTVAWRVDASRIREDSLLSPDDARRERMILRALLNQALYLLGPEEGEY